MLVLETYITEKYFIKPHYIQSTLIFSILLFYRIRKRMVHYPPNWFHDPLMSRNPHSEKHGSQSWKASGLIPGPSLFFLTLSFGELLELMILMIPTFTPSSSCIPRLLQPMAYLTSVLGCPTASQTKLLFPSQAHSSCSLSHIRKLQLHSPRYPGSSTWSHPLYHSISKPPVGTLGFKLCLEMNNSYHLHHHSRLTTITSLLAHCNIRLTDLVFISARVIL